MRSLFPSESELCIQAVFVKPRQRYEQILAIQMALQNELYSYFFLLCARIIDSSKSRISEPSAIFNVINKANRFIVITRFWTA